MAKFASYSLMVSEIRKKSFKPIYLFMGQESYFIDDLTDMLDKMILSETERDFNHTIFYGVDSDVRSIISTCQRYPMMSEYQVVIVKEAQRLNNFELLELYAKNPLKSTILIINYKHGTVDGRKAVLKAIDKVGVIFDSKKVYENKVPAFISSYFRDRGFQIDQKSTQMLVDFVGNDLSKLVKELEKLQVVQSGNQQPKITPQIVEDNIGISKDYNNFELIKAIANKNRAKAFRIVEYFDKDQKTNPLPLTLHAFFFYFNNLVECFWLPNKSEQSVMNALNLRFSFMAADYMAGLRNYTVNEVLAVISQLRIFDAKSKGLDKPPLTTHGDLLRELVAKIMH